MRRSFTLLEVMVATGLLLLVLVGVASSQVAAQRLDALARERSHALGVGASVLEDLAGDFDNLPARNGETFDVVVETVAGPIGLKPGGGRLAPGVVKVRAMSPDLYHVTVDLRWRSASGGEGSLLLSTVVGRP